MNIKMCRGRFLPEVSTMFHSLYITFPHSRFLAELSLFWPHSKLMKWFLHIVQCYSGGGGMFLKLQLANKTENPFSLQDDE